ncbi:MAG: excinuclease ABC subunit UvrC [Clostridiales Family XIII bacterium]|jgi:excinuclease ABC subunit C|nr:excinuclease ABC subunit UvrC [Clostridiales Family XIII bacterium]
MFDIEENLKTLPDKPGVYLHKNEYGEIIYVGKAISLKKRVRQYFRSGGTNDKKVAAMVSHITEFEYIVTQTEMEALLLENTLIKRYLPQYNVMLRDDKTYPYIKITFGEEWPRLLKTRILKNDGSKYFGPYADVSAANRIIDLLNDIFRLKRCAYEKFPENYRPCLLGHIHKCRQICQGIADKEAYRKDIAAIVDFLKGHGDTVISYLTKEMHEASDELHFEEAAKYRDYIAAAVSVTEKQRVELLSYGNMDIILATDLGENSVAQVTVFFVRNGRLVGRENHYLDAGPESLKKEIVGAFVSQYYANQTMIPKEIVLEEHLDEEVLLAEMLSKNLGSGVKFVVPERGRKKELLRLAMNDVRESMQLMQKRLQSEQEKETSLAQMLRDILHLPEEGHTLRMEAYDISNTGGADTVGAMVVFSGSHSIRSDYRRFKIRGNTQGDDYGAMQEVLYRRLKRGINGDSGFSILPDLILIDGGTGHVHAAEQVVRAMGLNLLVAGMVKDDRHRTRALIYQDRELSLKERPELYRLIGNIQEEVHRFVIEYHRGVRKSVVIRSQLDEIPGVGEKRRNALLTFFGSVEAVKEADEQSLLAVPGMNIAAARSVFQYFRNIQ